MEPAGGRFLLVHGARERAGGQVIYETVSAPRKEAHLRVHLARDGAFYLIGRWSPSGPERLDVTVRDEPRPIPLSPGGWFGIPLSGAAGEEVFLALRADGRPMRRFSTCDSSPLTIHSIQLIGTRCAPPIARTKTAS